MVSRYTKEELIKILQKKAKELGRSPKQKEVKQSETIKRVFGSFNKGLEAAGLTTRKKSDQIYTKEELIAILQQKSKELGRVPKQKEVKQCGTIVRQFGSFNNGLEAAGLVVERIKREYTKEELIEILQQKAKELGRSPKWVELKQRETIVRKFGSYTEALKAAGLTLNRKKTYTKEGLIEILQQKAKELGRTPTRKEVEQQQGAITREFGSYNNGLKAAGLAINRKKTYTKEDLVEILQQREKELGRTPKKREVQQNWTIVRRFGSFKKGLEAAGLVAERMQQDTKENLIETHSIEKERRRK